MGLKKKKNISEPVVAEPPKLVRRRENRISSFKMGRTIGEKREKLETANERAEARKKDKKRKATRVVSTVFGFGVFAVVLGLLGAFFLGGGEPKAIDDPIVDVAVGEPTIQIIDEDGGLKSSIPVRMKNYIALAEKDFRDLGFVPAKAVIPSGAVREVDFYLEGHPGFIKMTIDRDSAVSVEDVDRMYRYLESIGVKDFSYIDVRINGKAYWK